MHPQAKIFAASTAEHPRRARALEERLDAHVEDLGSRVAAQRTALACGFDRERRLEASVRHDPSALALRSEVNNSL